jgi:drug/metabolite transporter (DMT)-like permease
MDVLLALMVLIWGGNYTIVKSALREIPPLPFNAVRLTIASVVFLALVAWGSRAAASSRGGVFGTSGRVEAREWIRLAWLGIVGHLFYQLLFIYGLDKTSVANSALIIGCTPVTVALVTAAVGHERITRWHWMGGALSIAGLYLVAGRGAEVTRDSLVGDACMVGAIFCWAVYTVFSRPLLVRHSPLVVNAYTMAFGAGAFVLVSLPAISRVEWLAVSAGAWVALTLSAIFALNVAYMVWYAAVQRIGNATTAMYSNLVPVVAMGIAWVGLGERVQGLTLAGAAAILSGVVLTRFGERVARRVAGAWRDRQTGPGNEPPMEG